LAVEDALARAQILFDLGRHDEAGLLVAQALAREPDTEDGLALLARVLIVGHRFQEAEAVNERLLRAPGQPSRADVDGPGQVPA
jgi:predicted Zn-dependent protease